MVLYQTAVLAPVAVLNPEHYTKHNTGVNSNIHADHNYNPYSILCIFIVPKSLKINSEATKQGKQSTDLVD